MTIAEPTTTLTDYAMGALSLVLGAQLLASGTRDRNPPQTLWGMGLLATGMASLIGGSSHGFAPYLSTDTRAAVWRATYGTLGMANLLILAAAAAFALRGAAASVAVFALTVRLALYLAFITSRPEFRYVVYDYVLTLLLLTIFAAHGRLRDWPGAVWMMAGIGVSFVGALIQRSGFALHRHFNHNDLFHVVQTIAIYLYYRAGVELH
ncbi:MAG TPA: hypothetical protein VGL15_14200 [Vicinamibacteria bacterium]|jgi:hypothetical protein